MKEMSSLRLNGSGLELNITLDGQPYTLRADPAEPEVMFENVARQLRAIAPDLQVDASATGLHIHLGTLPKQGLPFKIVEEESEAEPVGVFVPPPAPTPGLVPVAYCGTVVLPDGSPYHHCNRATFMGDPDPDPDDIDAA